jgi:hypothetical protein
MASKEQNLALVAEELAKTEVKIKDTKNEMFMGMRYCHRERAAAVS